MNEWIQAIKQCIEAEKYSKLPLPAPTPMEIFAEEKQITATCAAVTHMVAEDLATQKLAAAKRLEVFYKFYIILSFFLSSNCPYLSTYLSINISMYRSISLFFCLPYYQHIYFDLSIHQHIYICIYFSINTHVHTQSYTHIHTHSLSLSLSFSLFLSLSLSIHPSIHHPIVHPS